MCVDVIETESFVILKNMTGGPFQSYLSVSHCGQRGRMWQESE